VNNNKSRIEGLKYYNAYKELDYLLDKIGEYNIVIKKIYQQNGFFVSKMSEIYNQKSLENSVNIKYKFYNVINEMTNEINEEFNMIVSGKKDNNIELEINEKVPSEMDVDMDKGNSFITTPPTPPTPINRKRLYPDTPMTGQEEMDVDFDDEGTPFMTTPPTPINRKRFNTDTPVETPIRKKKTVTEDSNSRYPKRNRAQTQRLNFGGFSGISYDGGKTYRRKSYKNKMKIKKSRKKKNKK